jgi:hypothetical protein
VAPPSLLDMYDGDVMWWYTYACGLNFCVYVCVCVYIYASGLNLILCHDAVKI